MSLEFPDAPVENQIFSANGKSWEWVGGLWKAVNSVGTNYSAVTVSPVSGVVTLDLSVTLDFIVNLNSDATLEVVNVPAGVVEIDVDIVQDSTGGWDLALPANFYPMAGSDTVVNQIAGVTTVLIAKNKDGAVWHYSMQEVA